jgi:hypothetical protein
VREFSVTSDIVFAFMQEMENFRTMPTNQHNVRYASFEIPGMRDCTHVFVKNEARVGLQDIFRGPYEVIRRTDDGVVIRLPTADGFREDMVNSARVKPAFIQRFDDIDPQLIIIILKSKINSNQYVFAWLRQI